MTDRRMSPPGDQEDRPAPTRGRPISTDRTRAILRAAIEELSEMGWNGFRVQGVAERASAGLATIYRRWSTKEELIAAAVQRETLSGLVRSGDPRADLRESVRTLAEEIGPLAGALAGLLGAAGEYPVIHDAMAKELGSIRRVLVSDLEELLGIGHSQIALIADSVPSLLIVRAVVMDDVPDPENFADEIVGLVDIMAGTLPGSAAP